MTARLQLSQMIIKAVRERGITVASLTERSGLSRAAVDRLLSGGDVRISTALAVTHALGLSLELIPKEIIEYIPDVLDGTHGKSPIGQFSNDPRSKGEGSQSAKSVSRPISAVRRRSRELDSRIQKLLKLRKRSNMPKNPDLKTLSRLSQQSSIEEKAWLEMAPMGREFGSPDYERLTALDHAAFAAFQSWEQVRVWLETPNAELDGVCPEDAVRSPDEYGKVISALKKAARHASEAFMRDAEQLPAQERGELKGVDDVKQLKGMFARPAEQVSNDDMNAAIVRHGAGKK